MISVCDLCVCLQSAALLAGGSLTERLLRQNAELTGFVSRLTEEKNDLRNQTLRLEEELRRYRHTGLGGGLSVSYRGYPVTGRDAVQVYREGPGLTHLLRGMWSVSGRSEYSDEV